MTLKSGAIKIRKKTLNVSRGKPRGLIKIIRSFCKCSFCRKDTIFLTVCTNISCGANKLEKE
jgi:hypothetical protein